MINQQECLLLVPEVFIVEQYDIYDPDRKKNSRNY